jgi:pilus assembly protein Flp/PilA
MNGFLHQVAKLDQASPPGGRPFKSREFLMSNFVNMMKDEAGASAAEYALILAIVGSGIALAAVALGGSISSAMGRAATRINTTTY